MRFISVITRWITDWVNESEYKEEIVLGITIFFVSVVSFWVIYFISSAAKRLGLLSWIQRAIKPYTKHLGPKLFFTFLVLGAIAKNPIEGSPIAIVVISIFYGESIIKRTNKIMYSFGHAIFKEQIETSYFPDGSIEKQVYFRIKGKPHREGL